MSTNRSMFPALVEDDFERREGSKDRRYDVRCECGHGKLWHPAKERCYASGGECKCIDYRPVPDRRES